MINYNTSTVKSLVLILLVSIQLGSLTRVRCADIKQVKEQIQSLTDVANITNKETNNNDKTNSSYEANSTVLPAFAPDDWSFEMVEYDLMDYLENLSARYQLSGTNATSNPTLVNSTIDGDIVRLNSGGQEPQSIQEATQSSVKPDHKGEQTPMPELATSIANLADQQISESSWQYGIFDRFTRPKSTSTTAEPKYAQDYNRESTERDYNSDQCGLRTYSQYSESPTLAADQNQQLDRDSEATKELHQRRQRPTNIDELDNVDKRPHHFETIADYMKNRDPITGLSALDKHKISNWPNKDEKNAYDSYEKNPDVADSLDQQANQNGDKNDEFNLLARRNWLQQQLGNTLQLFGFNSSHSLPEPLQATANEKRENLMKVSGKMGKVYKFSTEDADINKEISARQDDLKLEARVIGGNDARLGDSPWSVSLQALVARPGTGGIEYRHYCGGTIISEHYVLTAAHCLDFMVGRESRLFVVIGDLNWRMSTTSQYGRRFGIDKLIIHSQYKNTAFGHDIGLIRTKERMRPIKANGRYIVNSVCLPDKGVEHSGEAELVGWGLFSNRNEMADSLQIADVPILPRPLCVDLYRRRTGLIQWLIGIELITDKQVCAGTFGRGICQGDSGSALVVNEKIPTLGAREEKMVSLRNQESTRATIIGVVAFGGIRRCSYQSLPGVYMQTSKYMDWILPRIRI